MSQQGRGEYKTYKMQIAVSINHSSTRVEMMLLFDVLVLVGFNLQTLFWEAIVEGIFKLLVLC